MTISPYSIWIPVIAAILSASLTAFFTFWLRRRGDYQSVCARTAALLACYQEELENGIRFMRESKEHIIAVVNHAQTTFQMEANLPRAFWDLHRIDLDGINALYRLRRSTSNIYDVHGLPSHLKNCFEHVTHNYRSLVSCWIIDSTPAKMPQLDKCIESYELTLGLCKRAIKELEAKSNRPWPLPLETPGLSFGD